ncbi:hypothetical protein J2797_006379 [Paraburkholderia terricola]|uniref:hypothetical protein n=1 Tax=Paraburkholderia terricola TaxID=169427 RepID=UPI0028580124|nr:hypothetical protein [Paraburkholderia terricola]MDR6496452.1 hypothetical protein [Paraburkholderia terricola]
MAILAALDAYLTLCGGRLQAMRGSVHDVTMKHALLVLRVGLAIYWALVAFTLPNTVYLTPELLAPSWVAWLQAACAVLVLGRRTSWLAGLGMIVLYVMAVLDDGWFHLLDYPIFLAIGFILVIARRGCGSNDAFSLQLLRWSAALTLLWGGIEKFVYPEWSFPLVQKIPALGLGVSPEAAMDMYGFGEAALSFGLLLFGVGSQVSAFFLFCIFVAAVPLFGWIDLVGHSAICVALALLALVKPQRYMMLRSRWRNGGAHAMLFAFTVSVLMAGYFGLHALYVPGWARSPFANRTVVGS